MIIKSIILIISYRKLIKMPKIKYKIIKFNRFIYFYLINIKKIKKININNFYYIRSVILFNLNLFAIYF